ncbi:hypothetical protein SAMN05421663_1164 [Terribacillus halophilus]|uniref:Uncharacterized protein n=1 Tax=Terribacillus halophilus TaxID=361279 RepID=A0A1G6WCV6_9BACI|nr:hypothetical protein [Terribacillus halophilus]SDD63629.1 hypothetical protein SAMN05421663_1164 [Terribacillus halophilus]
MTALSFYTVAIIAFILLLVMGAMIGIYLICSTYNRRRERAVMAEWQAARKHRV